MKKLHLFGFLLWMCCSLNSNAQGWLSAEMSPMPMRISNNAVTEAKVSGVPFVFSFGGIDSTKLYSGISKHSFRYNTVTDLWETIADLPDTLGKIASAASIVKNKIYIIGGYHVFANGSEISSNKVHVYDPETNSFLTDAQNIPVPIDDHVQAVWRDSLIFIISGWSNTTNVPNVQIFNPALNSWSVGTSVPNNSVYKVFGASGTILGDTIYYFGGASIGSNFPASSSLRMGIIDPANASQISWSNPVNFQTTYRCAASTDSLNNIYFFGGSAVTYNYDGIAYNGSGGVSPLDKYFELNACCPATMNSEPLILPMDLRGIASIGPSIKYLAGGMESGQLVSNKTLKLNWNFPVGTDHDIGLTKSISVFPNPVSSVTVVKHSFLNVKSIELISIEGELLDSFPNVSVLIQIDGTKYRPGIVFLRIITDKEVVTSRILFL